MIDATFDSLEPRPAAIAALAAFVEPADTASGVLGGLQIARPALHF